MDVSLTPMHFHALLCMVCRFSASRATIPTCSPHQGYCTFPLTLGCDCLGHIHYFDATLANSK